ncbi:colicin transporter, partial [Bifidobacterium longum]
MMNENDKTEILEPVETPAENITEPSKDGRKCPKWLPPLVAAVCAVILVAAGIVGWN